MNARVNVYKRDNQMIIVPCAGGGGVTYEIEPVAVIRPVTQEVGAATSAALEVSRQAMGKPLPNLRGYKSPVLAALRLRSAGQFHRNIALCGVYTDGAKVFLQPYRPARDGRGFEIVDEPRAVSDPAAVGQNIVEILESSPRLNPGN